MNSKYFALPLALALGVVVSIESTSAQSAPPIAGCTAASFVEGGATNMIQTSGASYTPKCLHIRVGASVTIQASGHHPLSAMPDIDGAANPFRKATPFVDPATQVFNQPGIYGYFCEAHGDSEGDGMAGVIWVD